MTKVTPKKSPETEPEQEVFDYGDAIEKSPNKVAQSTSIGK